MGADFKNSLYAFGQSEKSYRVQCIIIGIQTTIIAILLGHEHLIWVALPLPRVQCCLQTLKAPILKELGQMVLSNIQWGKGRGWGGPTTYDSDCRNAIQQSTNIYKNINRQPKIGRKVRTFNLDRENNILYKKVCKFWRKTTVQTSIISEVHFSFCLIDTLVC